MEYPTCYLHFLGMHTRLKAYMIKNTVVVIRHDIKAKIWR